MLMTQLRAQIWAVMCESEVFGGRSFFLVWMSFESYAEECVLLTLGIGDGASKGATHRTAMTKWPFDFELRYTTG